MKKCKILFLSLLIFSLLSLKPVEISAMKDNGVMVDGKFIELPERAESREEEFRGVWVSTVYNIDFPSRPGLSEAEFKKEYRALLDRVEELNLNSVIFQVRPEGDAFYPSKINPWSEALTGSQGKAPGFSFDPMEWIIEETHKRGLDFHAWFNPYRITKSYSSKTKAELLNGLAVDNWARKNPDQVFLYQGKLYLNPGSRKVHDHIIETIMELVYKYDIDGVHLDDYFYPNKPANDIGSFYGWEEADEFAKTNLDQSQLASWRRENINQLIRDINKSLKSYNKSSKKNVEFGVSPFGIWRTKLDSSLGVDIPKGALTSYDRQFVDSRLWVKEGLIDYIVPQIYWTFDTKAAPYGSLVNWWVDQVRGTDVKLYIGHANYKLADKEVKGSWENSKEISNQIKYGNRFKEVGGNVFFSYRSLLSGRLKYNDEFLDILREEHYKKKARLPKKSDKGSSNQEHKEAEGQKKKPASYHLITGEGIREESLTSKSVRSGLGELEDYKIVGEKSHIYAISHSQKEEKSSLNLYD